MIDSIDIFRFFSFSFFFLTFFLSILINYYILYQSLNPKSKSYIELSITIKFIEMKNGVNVDDYDDDYKNWMRRWSA